MNCKDKEWYIFYANQRFYEGKRNASYRLRNISKKLQWKYSHRDHRCEQEDRNFAPQCIELFLSKSLQPKHATFFFVSTLRLVWHPLSIIARILIAGSVIRTITRYVIAWVMPITMGWIGWNWDIRKRGLRGPTEVNANTPAPAGRPWYRFTTVIRCVAGSNE